MNHMRLPAAASLRRVAAPLRPGTQHRMLHILPLHSGPKGGVDGIWNAASPGGEFESALWRQHTDPVSQAYQSLSSSDTPPADASPAAALHMGSPTPDKPSHHHPPADQPDPRSSPMVLPHTPTPGATSSSGYAEELQSGSLNTEQPHSSEQSRSHKEPQGHDRSSGHTSTGSHPVHATPGEEGVEHFSHHAPAGTAYTRDKHTPEAGFMGNERAVAASDAGADTGLQWETPTAAEHHHHPQQHAGTADKSQADNQLDIAQDRKSEGHAKKPRGMFSP